MDRPLSGIRVLGLEQYISAPYCTMLLADAGAEVIKIERPGRGDPRRSIPPFAFDGQGRRVAGGFIGYNRNKKSLAVDLRTSQGKLIFEKLVKTADVVVENLRPDSIDNLGLGYRHLKAINAQIIYAAISGFGLMPGYKGPYSDRPAFDIIAEAMSGIMNLVGFADKPPSWTIYGMADIYTGMVTAYGVMLALFMRARTGKGQFVDSAMLDNMLSLNERMVTLFSFTGEEPQRGSLKYGYPRGAFLCQDGYMAINIPDDVQWGRLCDAMQRPDLKGDARTCDAVNRGVHADFVCQTIEGWLANLSRDQAVEILERYGVPAGPVYTTQDVLNDPHIQARQMLVTIDDPVAGPRQFVRSPLLLSESPGIATSEAPRLGSHTLPILRDGLGYSQEEIDLLQEAGVVAVSEE